MTKLTSKPRQSPTPKGFGFDFNDIISDIDCKMKEIGMTIDMGRKYLHEVYGVKSRYCLNDNDLIDFWTFMNKQKDLSNILNRINKSKSEDTTKPKYDGWQMMKDIDTDMKRLGMTIDLGRKFIKKVYGVESRYFLDNSQFIHFWQYMRRQEDLSDILRSIA